MQTTDYMDKDVFELVQRERELAVSDREWKHRLRGYGYAIRDYREGTFVTPLLGLKRLVRLN